MLISSSLAEFAIIEYNRDRDFHAFVDKQVAELIAAGAVPLGTPLRAILEGEDAGLPRAKQWLETHHASHTQAQWQRLREPATAR